MPELPDVSLYTTRLQERVIGNRLEAMRFYGPSVLRSFDPPPAEILGKTAIGVERIGKRIVVEMEDERFIVVHPMISGRFTWTSETGSLPFKGSKILLAAWQWTNGRLILTEASTKKRAAVYLVRGRENLTEHRRSGLDVFTASNDAFAARMREPNRTLKRALTNPNTLDGVGNAYSDEILFAAKLSPVKTTGKLSPAEMERLLSAARAVLSDRTNRLEKMYPGFPKPAQITAFRPEFNVHGRFGQPCRVCGAPIQRIVYADNETNYCALCQNEGRLLADRSLSRLLKDDWPKALDFEHE